MDDLAGLWIPTVTPFDRDDEVDAASLQALARRLLAEGAHGLVALGTTGEPAVLSDGEQRTVVELLAEVCAVAGSPLMVGCGTNSTRRTIETVHRFADVADAVLVVVPYYTRPSTTAIVEHYRIVASESPVPVVAYNVPYRTGRGLDASDVLRLASIPNVVGIKQATGALDADTLAVLRDAPPSFSLLAGDDAFIGPTMLMGGRGAIAAAAHLCTPSFRALVDAAGAGDAERTKQLTASLFPVVLHGFAEPSPAVWKGALHGRGELATPNLRPPMSAASPPAIAAVLEAAAHASR